MAFTGSVPVFMGLLLLLNVPLSLHRWFPTDEYMLLLVPTVESLVIIWILHLKTRKGRRNTTSAAGVFLGVLLGILSGLAAAEAFFRFFYARSFSLRGDLPMVRGGLLLLLGEIGPLIYVIAPLTIAALLVVLGLAGWTVVHLMTATLRRFRPQTAALVVITLIVLIPLTAAGRDASITAVTFLATQQAGSTKMDTIATTLQPAPPQIRSEDEQAHYRFPGLQDRDIYIFLVEAYGYASTYRPELTEHIDPPREHLEAVLQDKGYRVVTTYLESPVAGGYSWLADATLLTGQWINSQERFLQLYDADLPTLSGTLHDAGYYTFTLRPGTVHEPWPEGWDLYHFEESVIGYGGGFSYRGPRFSYVSVPDQFALWRGHQRLQELTAPGGDAYERPVLAYYQLVSSHTPFTRIPPFIPDWNTLGNGDIYHLRADDILLFNNSWTGGTQLIEGYVASISYVFTVLTDYVQHVMDDSSDPIIVILGDHEPQRPIRSPQSVKSVPVHIAARDAVFLSRLIARGFTDGIHPDQPPPHERMSTFFPMLMDIAREPR